MQSGQQVGWCRQRVGHGAKLKVSKPAACIGTPDTIADEIRKAQTQLDLLLRKAKETLKVLQVELREEGAERDFPIALPNHSLQEASKAIERWDADLAIE